MDTEGSGATRAGGEDFHNEDAFVVEDGLGLYVVCDGASERPGGEVASTVASRALEQFIEHSDDTLELRGEDVAQWVVSRAMRYALRALDDVEEEDRGLRGLTTTVTMLLAHDGRGVIGHRGDSRAYLIRRDRAQQLTRDHELAQSIASEVPTDEDEDDDFDVFAVDLRAGDTVVLCTDGAEAALDDDGLVRTAGDLSPRLLASRIVSTAHRRRSDADATAVVVRVRREAGPGWLELSTPPLGTSFGHTHERPSAVAARRSGNS